MKMNFFIGALTVSIVFSMLAPVDASAADKKIERLWGSKCASCHGKDGKGKTEKGQKLLLRDMTTAEFQKGSDADFKKAILEGVNKEKGGVKQEMDSFKDELKPADVDALVSLIRELK